MTPPPTKPYKAVIAAVVAFAGALGGSLSDGHVSASEWLTAIGAGVFALASVYQVTNTPRDGGSNDKNNGAGPSG